ncbi:phosphotransferase family protein [Saccharopolyspora sp. ASAGF58]|uniref:phosphotransferase family protein n=1 Tax=Saccharopolyspora sp. ASAGF58 TaxID=2719023 RepID=UPI001FF0BBDD|nr:phosphotransferase family protein [Saccharopolyspora sp. ASAGF58]
MTALRGTPVPVPITYAICPDDAVLGAPFYVMERVEGTPYRWARELAPLGAGRVRALSEQLVEVLAALHEVQSPTVGLAEFGRPDGFLARHVRRWGKQMDASRTRALPQHRQGRTATHTGDSPPTASRARQRPSTRPRKDSTVTVGRSSTTRIREAKNTRARLLDRPLRLGQPDDLPPETAPSSHVPPGQKPAATLRSTLHTPWGPGASPQDRRCHAASISTIVDRIATNPTSAPATARHAPHRSRRPRRKPNDRNSTRAPPHNNVFCAKHEISAHH